MHRLFTRFLTGIACLLLAGCFDIREEFWIHKDGSGKADLTYVIPDSALYLTGGTGGIEAKIRELMATQPKLSLDEVSVKEGEKGVTVHVKISTKSMLDLIDLKKDGGMSKLPASAVDIVGDFDVRLKGLDVDFARTIKVKDALGLASLAVGKDERANRRLTYILHLPKPPAESNAMTVEDGGKTLKWDVTLGEAIKQPLVTSFRARMPIPTAVWYALGLVVVALIALGRMIWKWRKKAKRPAIIA